MILDKAELLRDGVNVIGYFQGKFGLGESGRLLVNALEKSSIPFSLLSADFSVANQTLEPYSRPLEEKVKYAINIFCIDPYLLMPVIDKFGIALVKDRYNILLFFWETNVVPAVRLKLLSYFDEIWVATHYNLATLSPAIRTPIFQIPHPLQMDESPEIHTKASFGLNQAFTFLFCFDFFSNFHRKNPMAIIQAFRKAFHDQNDVQLVIKSQNGHHYPDQLNPALKLIKGDPRIIWIDESMDPKRRFDLMKACDCYISLHRSEGFGLTMAEAMLMEKPVIATGYSGNLDFMTHDNSYLCQYKLVPIGPNNQHYSFNGDWADVDVDEAAFWMGYVLNNPAEAKAKAIKGKVNLLHNHSSAYVGACISKRLETISAGWDSKKMQSKKRKHYPRFFIDALVYHTQCAWMKTKKCVKKQIGI